MKELEQIPQPKDWKALERHPLSAEYDDISGPDWERFVAGLRKHGIVARSVVLFERKVLDGWQLQRACVEVGLKPLYVGVPAGIDARDFVNIRNENRRHEDAERIAARRERVAKARAEGQSIRAIAEAEEVAVVTVQRDLETVNCTGGGTVEPAGGKVTGRDGRTRTAKPKPDQGKKPEILCRKCDQCWQNKTPIKQNCPACAELRKSPEERKLPKSVANALADTWHAECARLLSKMRVECKGAFTWSSWLDAAVLDHLRAAEECFKSAIPRKVCPDCEGQKVVDKVPCLTCRQGGYLASQA